LNSAGLSAALTDILLCDISFGMRSDFFLEFIRDQNFLGFFEVLDSILKIWCLYADRKSYLAVRLWFSKVLLVWGLGNCLHKSHAIFLLYNALFASASIQWQNLLDLGFVVGTCVEIISDNHS
jgi:hypothetical protein